MGGLLGARPRPVTDPRVATGRGGGVPVGWVADTNNIRHRRADMGGDWLGVDD